MVRALHELDRLRNGLNPTSWRPMKTVGTGAREIRVRLRGEFRIVYVANRPGTVFVLHAFRKKSAKTRKSDIELARKRLKEL
jgi:phage-related protein